MSAAKPLLDNKFLKTLVPLNELTPDLLSELNEKSRILEYTAGSFVCKTGERDNRTLYLLSGRVAIVEATGGETVIKADTKPARFPLANDQPRRAAVIAKGQVSILAVDADLLDVLLNWDKGSGYQVTDLEGEGETDWMSLFLQSKAFLKLRPDNIQELMMRMDEVPVKAGQIIVKQGATDDSYYIIKSGRCRVSRRSSPEAPEIKLAEIGIGTGFGEEALITNGRRNANVTAIDDGCLMRLSKTDFTRLLVQPLVDTISYADAKQLPAASTVWIDVRSLEEFAADGIAGSINLPLAEIRLKLQTLDRNKKFVVYSNSSNRAAAAVFLLNQQGLDCVVLDQGLTTVPADDRRKGKAKPKAAPAAAKAETAEIPTIDNVVRLQAAAADAESAAPAAANANDPRVFALLNKAKQRVQQESERAHKAEEARKRMAEEVARLKAEAEQSRLQAEELRAASEQAHAESEQAMAQLRADESARRQSAINEASQRSQAEAQRVEVAEQARRDAEAEKARLVQEVEMLRRRMEDELQRTAEEVRSDAERESACRREAELASKQAELQAAALQVEQQSDHAKLAEQARLQAEAEVRQLKEEMAKALEQSRAEARQLAEQAQRTAEQQTQQILAEAERRQQEAEQLAQRLEAEAQRASAAEAARHAAEQEIERLRGEAELARLREEEILRKQIEIEETSRRAEQESQRAQQAEEYRQQAEAEIERLKQEVEAARHSVQEQARQDIDAARLLAEQQAAQARETELKRKQEELETVVRQAEVEAERAQEIEAARQRANTEIEQLRAEAEQARRELEDKARQAAEAARMEAEEQAARRFEDEMERQQAEILRLRHEAEQARLQLEEQSRTSIAKARFEAEKQAKYLRQQELAHKQAELEEAAHRAQQETLRAETAEQARRKAEAEIAQLRAEADAARAEMERQARIFAAARFDTEQDSARQRQEILQRQQAETAAAAERQKRSEQDKNHGAEQERKRLQQEMEHLKNEVSSMQQELKARYREQAEAARRQDDSVQRQRGRKANVFDAPEKKAGWISEEKMWDDVLRTPAGDLEDELASMMDEADQWLNDTPVIDNDEEPLTSLNDLIERPAAVPARPAASQPAAAPVMTAQRATFSAVEPAAIRSQATLPKRQKTENKRTRLIWIGVIVGIIVLAVGAYFMMPQAAIVGKTVGQVQQWMQSLASDDAPKRDALTELKARMEQEKRIDAAKAQQARAQAQRPFVTAAPAVDNRIRRTPVTESRSNVAAADAALQNDVILDQNEPAQVNGVTDPQSSAVSTSTVEVASDIKPETLVMGGNGVQVRVIEPLSTIAPANTPAAAGDSSTTFVQNAAPDQ